VAVYQLTATADWFLPLLSGFAIVLLLLLILLLLLLLVVIQLLLLVIGLAGRGLGGEELVGLLIGEALTRI
jgi:hypothetical protein